MGYWSGQNFRAISIRELAKDSILGLKSSVMGQVGYPELLIILMTVGFLLAGIIRRKFQIPTLKFERTSDIVLAIGIVTGASDIPRS